MVLYFINYAYFESIMNFSSLHFREKSYTCVYCWLGLLLPDNRGLYLLCFCKSYNNLIKWWQIIVVSLRTACLVIVAWSIVTIHFLIAVKVFKWPFNQICFYFDTQIDFSFTISMGDFMEYFFYSRMSCCASYCVAMFNALQYTACKLCEISF